MGVFAGLRATDAQIFDAIPVAVAIGARRRPIAIHGAARWKSTERTVAVASLDAIDQRARHN
jgi:hypothetical protein